MWEFGAGGEWACHTRRAGAHIEGPSVSSYPIFSSSFFWYITIRANAHHRRVLRGCVGVGCSAIGIVPLFDQRRLTALALTKATRKSPENSGEQLRSACAKNIYIIKKNMVFWRRSEKGGSERIDISVAE